MPLKPKKKPTIRDIAKIADCSTYTVSSVLNGKGKISEGTRKRILGIAQELNYDILGNVAVAKRITNRCIGIVLPNPFSLKNEFYMRAVITVRYMCIKYNYDSKLFDEENILKYFSTDADRVESRNAIACKGLILFCPVSNYAEYVDKLLKQNIAVALVRRKMKSMAGLFQAHDDDNESMAQLLDYVLGESRARRIALVSNFLNDKHVLGDRENVVFERVRQELHADDFFLFHGKADFIDEEMKNLCSFIRQGVRVGKKVTLMCWSDETALHIISRLHKHGINVPGDAYLTGYNDDPISSLAVPSITTMRIPVEAMIGNACRYLFDYIDESAGLPAAKEELFEHQLIIRETTSDGAIRGSNLVQ